MIMNLFWMRGVTSLLESLHLAATEYGCEEKPLLAFERSLPFEMRRGEKNGGFHGGTLHLFVVFFRSSHNANLHATDGLDAEAAKLRHGRHDAC